MLQVVRRPSPPLSSQGSCPLPNFKGLKPKRQTGIDLGEFLSRLRSAELITAVFKLQEYFPHNSASPAVGSGQRRNLEAAAGDLFLQPMCSYAALPMFPIPGLSCRVVLFSQ